jgi:hypothetical protein
MPIKDYDKPAEIALIEACRMGGGLQISTELPTEGTAENTIRVRVDPGAVAGHRRLQTPGPRAAHLGRMDL